MAEQYAPPSGPPPPTVPPGWTAQFNQQYQAWFYVNLHTEQSQWEQPTIPAGASSNEGLPGYTGPPNNPSLSDTKQSNNPYNQHQSGAGAGTEDDAAMAARLQAEEDAQANTRGHSPYPTNPQHSNPNLGSSQGYYSQTPNQGYPGPNQAGPGGPGYYQQQQQQQQYQQPAYGTGAPAGDGRSNKFLGGAAGGGLMGKLASKLAGKSGGGHGGGHHGGPGYGGPAGYGSHGGHGGYGGYGHGFPPPHQQKMKKNKKGGMGAGGAAALGVGGGLLGGMALGNAMDGDHDGGGYGSDCSDGSDGGGGDDFDDGGGDDGGGE